MYVCSTVVLKFVLSPPQDRTTFILNLACKQENTKRVSLFPSCNIIQLFIFSNIYNHSDSHWSYQSLQMERLISSICEIKKMKKIVYPLIRKNSALWKLINTIHIVMLSFPPLVVFLLFFVLNKLSRISRGQNQLLPRKILKSLGF